MRPPYRQTDSNDGALRAHSCTLFSLLYLRRWASEGDVSPSAQGAIDDAVRDLRTAAGVSMADFLRRGTTITEAERAFEQRPIPGRLPPRMRLMRGGSVRDDLLPELQAGNLAIVAVNYGAAQDGGKGVGSFRGGHAIVVGEPDNGTVAVADPLRSELVRWPIALLEKAMETFGEHPWGNGRGEAGVAYQSPTYRQAYTDTKAALADAQKAADRRGELLTAARTQVGLTEDERDQARRDLATAKARVAELEALGTPDCAAAVTAERARVRDVLVAAVDAAAAGLG